MRTSDSFTPENFKKFSNKQGQPQLDISHIAKVKTSNRRKKKKEEEETHAVFV